MKADKSKGVSLGLFFIYTIYCKSLQCCNSFNLFCNTGLHYNNNNNTGLHYNNNRNECLKIYKEKRREDLYETVYFQF